MNDKNIKILIGVISIVVVGLVALMYSGVNLKPEFDANFPGFDKKIFPLISAVLNSLVFVSLALALRAIKNRDVQVHRSFIYMALALSTLFLVNYVFYHMIADSTPYGGEGISKTIYLFILLTHILLAIVSFPFILYTVLLGQTYQTEKHRKLGKIVMPVWMYVAITGVIVYLMISPYYV